VEEKVGFTEGKEKGNSSREAVGGLRAGPSGGYVKRGGEVAPR